VSDAESARPAGSVTEVFRAALKLGLTSFGGPIAHLGYLERTYVQERRWLSEADYAGIVGLCQLLPGPSSSQVGFLIGHHRAGWRGALAAWMGFTLPSALLMYAFLADRPRRAAAHADHGFGRRPRGGSRAPAPRCRGAPGVNGERNESAAALTARIQSAPANDPGWRNMPLRRTWNSLPPDSDFGHIGAAAVAAQNQPAGRDALILVEREGNEPSPIPPQIIGRRMT
jgi:hypothetical protein